MKLHGNARTCPNSRRLIASRVTREGLVAQGGGGSGRRERADRAQMGRRAPAPVNRCEDRSSRPHRSPARLRESRVRGDRAVAAGVHDRGRDRRGPGHGAVDGVAVAEADRPRQALRLEPLEPPNRYERRHPGELVHVDIKQLGRISVRGAGHRMVGHRKSQTSYRIDGKAPQSDRLRVRARDGRRPLAPRLCGGARRPHAPAARSPSCTARVAWFAARGITIRSVMTDNGSCYRRPRPSRRAARAGPPPPAHPSLPPAHQRQGRALHPDAAERVGLCTHLRQLSSSAPAPCRCSLTATTSDDHTAPSATRLRSRG